MSYKFIHAGSQFNVQQMNGDFASLGSDPGDTILDLKDFIANPENGFFDSQQVVSRIRLTVYVDSDANSRELRDSEVIDQIGLLDNTIYFILRDETPPEQLVSEFGGDGNGPGEFYNSYGVPNMCVFEQELFITDRYNQRIQVFDLDGNFQRELNQNLVEPVKCVVSLREIFVTDMDVDTYIIKVFDLNGHFLREFPETYYYRDYIDIAASSDGELIIVLMDDKIVKYNRNGEVVVEFKKMVTIRGERNIYYQNLIVQPDDSGNDLYYLNNGRKIEVCDKHMNLVETYELGYDFHAGNFAVVQNGVTNKEIFVIDNVTQSIKVFDIDGNVLREFGNMNAHVGYFDQVRHHDICVYEGKVYVSNAPGNLIRVYM
jgi:hypothetical protein